MPNTINISIKDLKLDLSNFRTVPQANELDALQAMISISADRFWALMDSLIDDGYLPNENILVLEKGQNPTERIVKEGNRRAAALKIIHGYFNPVGINIPDHIADKIRNISNSWKTDNDQIPCAVYSENEKLKIDRIIALTHGKGEKAGRDQWSAVARARHSRDVSQNSEPALDLLEKYLQNGKNLTWEQAKRWSGEYPLTVLDDAIKRISTRLGVSNAPELAKKYPLLQHRHALDEILKDIGLQAIRFETIRKSNPDFAVKYGIPISVGSSSASNSQPSAASSAPSSQPSAVSSASNSQPSVASSASNSQPSAASSAPSSQPSAVSSAPSSQPSAVSSASNSQPSAASSASGNQSSGSKAAGTSNKTSAVAINDPRSVMRHLRKLAPSGNNRQKVVLLRNEALKLKLSDNPLAFCFIVRSMFEISAKAYCDDQKINGGPSFKKINGQDKNLVDVLKDITNHLTNNNADQAMVRSLHGSITELSKSDGLLSVTSMNQLIHNPTFSVTAGDIATVFGNIFPLLEAINK